MLANNEYSSYQLITTNKIDPFTPVSILSATLFPIFISYLPDVISPQIRIYANDTSIYSDLNSKSFRSDNVNLSADLENDLLAVVNWGKKRLVDFNTFQTKLLSFKHHKETFSAKTLGEQHTPPSYVFHRLESITAST